MSDISRLELTKLNGKPLRVQLIALLAICLLLTDILIEIAKGLTMGYLQWKLKEKSSLQEAIEAHAGSGDARINLVLGHNHHNCNLSIPRP